MWHLVCCGFGVVLGLWYLLAWTLGWVLGSLDFVSGCWQFFWVWAALVAGVCFVDLPDLRFGVLVFA